LQSRQPGWSNLQDVVLDRMVRFLVDRGRAAEAAEWRQKIAAARAAPGATP